jgi:hypothetical protein
MPGPLRRYSQRLSQGGARRLQSQPAMVAKMVPVDFVRALPWRGASDASNTAGRRRFRAGSSRANQLVRQAPGLGSKGSARQGMASAIMERSARHRAGSAAGGTAMALRQADNQPRADAISGIPSGARRRSFSLPLRSAAAGGKRYNAQQNAYRRLPPGGNAGCRSSR